MQFNRHNFDKFISFLCLSYMGVYQGQHYLIWFLIYLIISFQIPMILVVCFYFCIVDNGITADEYVAFFTSTEGAAINAMLPPHLVARAALRMFNLGDINHNGEIEEDDADTIMYNLDKNREFCYIIIPLLSCPPA